LTDFAAKQDALIDPEQGDDGRESADVATAAAIKVIGS